MREELDNQALTQRRIVTLLPLAAIVFVAYPRVMLWHSGDADNWFVPWLQTIIAEGSIRSLAEPMKISISGANGFANYTPPYLYVLSLGSILYPWFAPLAIVKLVAILGLFMASVAIYWLVRQLAGAERALLAAVGMFLLPTAVLNAPGWGQADAFYAGLVVLCVAFALREQFAALMLSFGVALAFKLQAAFIAPFIAYLVLSRRAPAWVLPLPAFAYAAMMLPAWIAGRPAWELLTIYVEQANTYQWLSMNVPNPWLAVQHLDLMPYRTGVLVGTVLAATAGLGIAGLALRVRLNGADLLWLATASATMMPYLLPKMHDRYFFIADLLSYALAMVKPQWSTIMVAVLIQLGSAGAYSSHMFGFRLGTPFGAVCIGAALVIILVRLWRMVIHAETHPTLVDA